MISSIVNGKIPKYGIFLTAKNMKILSKINTYTKVFSPGLIVVAMIVFVVIVVVVVVVVVFVVEAVWSRHSILHSALNVALYSLPLQSLAPDTTLGSSFVPP